MGTITIVSKQPPGGRCSLYMRYAATLREQLGFSVEVRYCDNGTAITPPALLINETIVAPSDGVIVAPEDIAGSLHGRLPEPEKGAIITLLEEAQERWMEEWSDV